MSQLARSRHPAEVLIGPFKFEGYVVYQAVVSACLALFMNVPTISRETLRRLANATRISLS